MSTESSHDLPAAGAQWLTVLQQTSAVTRRVRRRLGSLTADQGLTDTELFVLRACARGPDPGVAQIDLADQIGASTAQTSGLVEKLRERGWLIDQRDTGDRRRRLWTISPSGRAVLDQVLGSLKDRLALTEQLPDFPPESADQLIELISQWSTVTIAGLASKVGTRVSKVGTTTDQTKAGTPTNSKEAA